MSRCLSQPLSTLFFDETCKIVILTRQAHEPQEPPVSTTGFIDTHLAF